MIGIRFRVVEGDPTLNFGLFLYCGLIPFLAFSESLNKGINSIKGNSGLVQKVVFPLELLPFTNAITSLVDKFFGVGALLLILLVLNTGGTGPSCCCRSSWWSSCCSSWA